MRINMPDLANGSSDSQSQFRGDTLQLREWASERCHLLSVTALRCSLGTQEDCAVRLSDADVFPLHARLSRERRQWMLRALGDTACIWCDGTRITLCSLAPGMEIRVGHTTLIVEDRWWITLRAFCARLLGWGSDRMLAVDQALRSIRMCLTHRAPLLLRGDSDMVPIAQALHRRVLGADRPFIVCDPRRRQHRASVRSPASYKTVAAAAQAAFDGALCVRSRRLPPDLAALRAWLADTDVNVRLMVCLDRAVPSTMLPASIDVPSLSTRVSDLPRIIDEYAHDAIAALGSPVTSFGPGDHDWVLAHATTSLPEIEKATLRRVALRSSSNLSRAAARLGMAPVSLSRWLTRRNCSVGTH
jgi:hypothetical protein